MRASVNVNGTEITVISKGIEFDSFKHEAGSNAFTLNIPRYVDTFEEEVEIDIDAVQVEIDGRRA